MNKMFKKFLSIVIVLVMAMSTITVAFASETAQPGEKVAVTDFVDDVYKIAVMVLEVTKTFVEEYSEFSEEFHSNPDNQWNITLGEKDYDILSVEGAAGAVISIRSVEQLKYVALQYLEAVLTKALMALANTVPDADFFMDEATYESKNFYPGTSEFLDAPASRDAKWRLGYSQASLVPEDWETGEYYLGGFIDYNNAFSNKVEDILDDMRIRIVALDDMSGRGVSIFATVDTIGLSNAYIRQIRSQIAQAAEERGITLASVNVGSTHAHSCIDTQGLWTNLFAKLAGNMLKGWTGMGEMKKGINEDYLDFLCKTAAEAMEVALDDMKTGTLTYAKKDIGEGYFNNKNRESATSMDTTITRLLFTPDNGSTPTIIANFAAHPDVAGLPTDDGKGTGRELCGEYVYYTGAYLEKMGYNYLFINGAILGIYMARGVTGDGVTTTRRYEESIRYGVEIGRILLSLTLTEQEIIANPKISGEEYEFLLDIKGMTDIIIDDEEERASESYTLWYEDWTPVEETPVEPYLNIRIKEVHIPVTNPVMMLAGRLNLVNYNILRKTDGSYAVVTEVGYVEFGSKMKAVMVPGEYTSDLVYGGGSLTAEGSFSCQDYEHAPLVELFGDEELTAFGLSNDALGYLLPDNDYSLISYHELISLGRYAGSTIGDAFVEIANEVNA